MKNFVFLLFFLQLFFGKPVSACSFDLDLDKTPRSLYNILAAQTPYGHRFLSESLQASQIFKNSYSSRSVMVKYQFTPTNKDCPYLPSLVSFNTSENLVNHLQTQMKIKLGIFEEEPLCTKEIGDSALQNFHKTKVMWDFKEALQESDKKFSQQFIFRTPPSIQKKGLFTIQLNIRDIYNNEQKKLKYTPEISFFPENFSQRITDWVLNSLLDQLKAFLKKESSTSISMMHQ